MNNNISIHDRILLLVKSKGYVLPADVSKEIKKEIIFASAYLSELADNKKIRISHTKIGGSPVYYLEENAHRLQALYKYLKEKDKRAYDLINQRKVIRDIDQSPLLRVSLRSIKDFAIPFHVVINGNKELFWKWYMLEDAKVEGYVRDILSSSHPESKSIQSPTNDAVASPSTQEQGSQTDSVNEAVDHNLADSNQPLTQQANQPVVQSTNPATVQLRQESKPGVELASQQAVSSSSSINTVEESRESSAKIEQVSKAELKAMDSKIQDLLELEKKNQDTIAKLKVESENLEKMKNDYVEETKSLIEEKKGVKKEMDDIKIEIERLMQQKQKIESDNVALDEQKNKLRSEIDDIQNSRKQIEASINDQKQKLDEDKDFLKRKSKEFDELAEEMKRFELEKAAFEQQKQEFEKQLDAAEDAGKIKKDQIVKKPEPINDEFYDEIKKYCVEKNIKIIEAELIKKKMELDMIVEIPSPVGSMLYYAKAKNKKKVNDADLSTAFVKGQSKKMSVLYLTFGDLTKKAKDMLDSEFKNMTFTKIE